MPNNLTTNFGKVVVDTSLIPYIRSRDVEFTARNLKPYKLSKIFFDDIAVNAFCQVGNKLILDSKKVLIVNSTATTIAAQDIVYQGTSNTVTTFTAVVDNWAVSTQTLTLRSLSGNFDAAAQLFIEAGTVHDGYFIGQTFASASITSATDLNTSDIFSPGESVRCPVAGGNVFAKVLATSGDNVLYLNQNFITANITANGSDILAQSDFRVGDIVFQTSTGNKEYYSSTFRGVVEYFNILSPGTIAIKPLFGRLSCNSVDTSTNSSIRIWNATKNDAKAIKLVSFNANKFEPGGDVVSIADANKSVRINSYVHRSGILGNTSNPNTSSVILAVNDSSNHATLNANLIYFTTGTGVGEIRRIISISGREATLNSPMQLGYDSSTHYSIGNFVVDEYGTETGIFHIPSFPGYKFKTGNRILTITDTNTYNNPDYEMRSAATYAASGLLKTTQNIQTTPTLPPFPEVDADNLVAPISPADRTYASGGSKSPITGSTGSSTPRIPLGDGLSQTFFTPKPLSNKQDYGIFATSVDLFFRRKPNVAVGNMQLPVTVKIAEVQNGYPTKRYLASKTIQSKDVKISELPSVNDSTTLTKFTFDDPVYLEPNREYALIIGSDSPDYELFIAELGEEVLGSAPQPRRISEQPYAGSLFRSQNSSTWTAYQNQDLMFRINKAVFSSSGTSTFELSQAPETFVGVDNIILSSADLTFPASTLAYRAQGIFIDGTPDSGVQISPYSRLEYGVLQDRSSATNSNRRELKRGRANSYVLTVEMTTNDPDISPVVNTERLSITAIQYNINNAGISNNVISITNRGSGYSNTGPENTSAAAITTDADKVVVGSNSVLIGSSSAKVNSFAQTYRETYFPYPTYNVGFYYVTITNSENDNGNGAHAIAVANTDGTDTVNHIVMVHPGSGYLETPTGNVALGAAASNTQAFVVINGETSKSGGNIRSKYITREIVLEDGFEAGDLRVYMDAIRPSPTDIQVYYKVLSGDDVDRLSDKSWRRMNILKNIYSRNARTLIGLEFRPSLEENKLSYSENGVSYPIGGKFKNFQIKVCLLSPDGSFVPKVRNLRIIATPEG